jgi:hypothetical protein
MLAQGAAVQGQLHRQAFGLVLADTGARISTWHSLATQHFLPMLLLILLLLLLLFPLLPPFHPPPQQREMRLTRCLMMSLRPGPCLTQWSPSWQTQPCTATQQQAASRSCGPPHPSASAAGARAGPVTCPWSTAGSWSTARSSTRSRCVAIRSSDGFPVFLCGFPVFSQWISSVDFQCFCVVFRGERANVGGMVLTYYRTHKV